MHSHLACMAATTSRSIMWGMWAMTLRESLPNSLSRRRLTNRRESPKASNSFLLLNLPPTACCCVSFWGRGGDGIKIKMIKKAITFGGYRGWIEFPWEERWLRQLVHFSINAGTVGQFPIAFPVGVDDLLLASNRRPVGGRRVG